MNTLYRFFAAPALFFLTFNPCFAQTVIPLQQGKSTSIRGLSVVDDSIAWLSGSKGTAAITHNGGKTWDWQQVKGFEKADFRDIEAFSDKEAIIMSSGTPALILKTIDGGVNWQVKYKNTDTAYFFDAMDFANQKHGLVLGDPVNGKFVLMETIDGGETWKPFANPPNALPGEAAFAASGTCLRFDGNITVIVTGGTHSRELSLYNNSYPTHWVYEETSLKHGKSSQGAFSFSGYPGIIVGGDYQNDHSTDSVAEYYFYSGKEISSENGVFHPKVPPAGYQSCVEFISGQTFLSTGTPGSNITTDGGKTWKQIDNTSYNVCRKAKKGKLVLLAGNKGVIGMLKL
ncbi:MAG TPA: YCF48-related protein [Mucilaginibacter sp.]|jgi:hypothetical protein|nr:YCF48-related protein [Mucilaginibacter sp.]